MLMDVVPSAVAALDANRDDPSTVALGLSFLNGLAADQVTS